MSRAIRIENENVNLDKDAPETSPAQQIYLRASVNIIGARKWQILIW